jgi:hypothetical protein
MLLNIDVRAAAYSSSELHDPRDGMRRDACYSSASPASSYSPSSAYPSASAYSTNSYHIESFEALVRTPPKVEAKEEGACSRCEHHSKGEAWGGEGQEEEEEEEGGESAISSVTVTLRPVSTPGRPQVAPQNLNADVC